MARFEEHRGPEFPNPETRSPEDIERDIERTRSQMAGTLDDLQRQFSPGQMVDQALGYLNEKSGQVGPRVMDTIRENPVPVTLVGVGLAWLAAAGWSGGEPSGRDQSPRHGGPGSRMSGGPGYGAGRSGAGYRERSRSMAGTAGYGGSGSYGSFAGAPPMGERAFTERRISGERRSNGGVGSLAGAWSGPAGEADRRRAERRVRAMGQQVGETLGQAREGLSEAAETLGQRGSETVGEMRQTGGQVLGQAREKAHEWTEQAKGKTHELTEEARQRAQWVGERIQQRSRYVMEEQPLVLGALGIALGAAIGATLPRSREEDRLLGPARDELLHKADETGGEIIREAREQVKTGLEAMTEHVEEIASGMSAAGESGPPGTGSAGTSPSGETGHR